uniref:Uncharacterized protein n=1 Tax=Hyaloperonospora arabidopsidis (strain Emoy2) TaxID=559515 RepID=M4BNA3_HYAAE
MEAISAFAYGVVLATGLIHMVSEGIEKLRKSRSGVRADHARAHAFHRVRELGVLWCSRFDAPRARARPSCPWRTRCPGGVHDFGRA